MQPAAELLRDAAAPTGGQAELEPGRHATEREDEGARLVCCACGGFVTSPATRVAIDGRHRHHFMNPDGLRFEIGCFSSAPGVVAVGESSTVWTWFPGYAWRATICRGCARHLGWAYTRERDLFFGLIADRVIESGAPSAG